MLSICAMNGERGRYYSGLAQGDYYLKGGEPPGYWLGEGAEHLGLSGIVEQEKFLLLFEGRGPDGRPLVQNVGDPNRKSGWDLTFSAPKSVSVLWSQLGTAEEGHEIRAAHAAAVEAALKYVEQETGFTRRGKAGFIREKVKLLIPVFEHATSRAQDPQLHSHALILNVGLREDGTTGSLTSAEFYRHKMAAGAIYRAELASQLQVRLGLEIVRIKSWFEVEGVNKDLMSEFSKRRAEVQEILDEKKLSSAKASEIATLVTRHLKEFRPRKELFGEWGDTGKRFGFGLREARELISAGARWLGIDQRQTAALAIPEAVTMLTEQQSCYTSADLVRRTAELMQGQGAGAKAVLEAVHDYLAIHAINLGEHKGMRYFTTREILELEKQMLADADMLRGKTLCPVRPNTLGKIEKEFSHLNDQQKAALRHATASEDGIRVIEGMAGTGKTTLLSAAEAAWKKDGLKVMGTSLAGKAAMGLEDESKIKSRTLESLLYYFRKAPLIDLKMPDVVVVDEAGMVGTRQMAELIKHCRKRSIQLVLVGDAKQLQPIEGGGPFAALAKRFGSKEVTEIVRQNEQWKKTAIHQMAHGESDLALRAYAERGLLTVEKDREAARGALISQWKKEGISKPEENLILAGTNFDTLSINREIQTERRRAGKVTGFSVTSKTTGDRLYKNDRIIFTKNSGPLGVRNGMFGTVQRVLIPGLQGKGIISVKLDNGHSVRIDLKHYDHIQLGYAVTTHKAQGMTSKNAYVLTDESMQDRNLSYVQVSRAKEDTRIFSTEAEAGKDLGALAASMRRDRHKFLASDLLPPVSPSPARSQEQAQSLNQSLTP